MKTIKLTLLFTVAILLLVLSHHAFMLELIYPALRIVSIGLFFFAGVLIGFSIKNIIFDWKK